MTIIIYIKKFDIIINLMNQSIMININNSLLKKIYKPEMTDYKSLCHDFELVSESEKGSEPEIEFILESDYESDSESETEFIPESETESGPESSVCG